MFVLWEEAQALGSARPYPIPTICAELSKPLSIIGSEPRAHGTSREPQKCLTLNSYKIRGKKNQHVMNIKMNIMSPA